MPNSWGDSFNRALEWLWGEQPQPQPPTAPPLTIYPQVGPAEQMMQRALRERDLSPDTWALARRTPTMVVPSRSEDVNGGQFASKLFGQGQIVVRYPDGGMSSEYPRETYAHELRHAYQADSPLDYQRQGNPYSSMIPPLLPAQNWQYEALARRLAESQDPTSDEMRNTFEKINSAPNLYPFGPQANEIDAHYSDSADVTPERMPEYMRGWYQGWWNPNARPDSPDIRARGWVTNSQPMDLAAAPVYGPPVRPVQQLPQPTKWGDNLLDLWFSGIRPDAAGNWG